MRIAALIYFIYACAVSLSAQQNLLYNADFEIYDTCPQGLSAPWDYQIQHCLGWNAPTYATSDYFNVCNSGLVSTPTNALGYQKPYSGSAYCGFIAYSLSNGGCYGGSYWWEYIQGRFAQPLLANHTYNIGFRFSLADGSNTAVRQLGFYISTTAVINSCSPAPLNLTPQVTSSGFSYLKDTANWFVISGIYTAVGGEQFITIGNFKDSVSTDTICVYPNTGTSAFSYYYVDAGTLYDITDSRCDTDLTVTIPNIFTPNSDNLNDVWKIPDTCFKVNEIKIYNRWGVKVFETTKTEEGWDGRTTSGEPFAEGTYYFIISYSNKQENKLTKIGHLQLIR